MTVETPYCNRTKRRGVDLRFDGISHPKITVSFETYVYQTDQNGHPINCPSENLLHAISHYRRVNGHHESDLVQPPDFSGCSDHDDHELEEASVASTTTNNSMESYFALDTYFEYRGKVLVIQQVSRDHLFCVEKGNFDMPHIKLHKADKEVHDAIREYN